MVYLNYLTLTSINSLPFSHATSLPNSGPSLYSMLDPQPPICLTIKYDLKIKTKIINKVGDRIVSFSMRICHYYKILPYYKVKQMKF